MNIGKLGEGVYLLTIGPSGRTIKPAKMAKAVKKTQIASDVRRLWGWRPQNADEWMTIPEAAKKLGVYPSSLYYHTKRLEPWLDRNDKGEVVLHKDALVHPANQAAFNAARINRQMAQHKKEDQWKRSREHSQRSQDAAKARMEAKIAAAVAEATAKDATSADWLSTAKLREEYHIPTHRLYVVRDLLKEYIAKPDGAHYLYHKSLLDNPLWMQYLTRPFGQEMVPPSCDGKSKTAESQSVRPVEAKPEVVEVAVASEAINKAELAESQAAAQPIVVNRKVYCKELDRTFDSVTDGAKAIGVRREILSKSLRAGHKCHGYTFEYVKAETNEVNADRTETAKEVALSPNWRGGTRPKKVLCVDLGVTFPSIAEAARATGCSTVALGSALKNGRECVGHTFRYVDPQNEKEGTGASQGRPVYCVEMNKTFPSVHAAARAVDRAVSTLVQAIKYNFRCGGYHFAYA